MSPSEKKAEASGTLGPAPLQAQEAHWDESGKRPRRESGLSFYPFELKPCFQIACGEADVGCLPGNALPEGTRLRVSFKGGSVRPVGGAERDVAGRVLSGGDWIMLREDGLVAFDARITLAASIRDVALSVGAVAEHEEEKGKKAPKDDFLFNILISGVAPGGGRGEAPADGTLPFVLPAIFEASRKKEPWATARLLRIAESNENYAWFTDRQCLAVGDVAFRGGRVVGAHYNVFALIPKGAPA